MDALTDDLWAAIRLSLMFVTYGFFLYVLFFPGGTSQGSRMSFRGVTGGRRRRAQGSTASVISGAIPVRHAMLRHSKFVQFESQNFSRELSPHDLHWRLEEGLEDQGITGVTGAGPRIISQWTPVVPGEHGERANVADYLAIEGGFRGKRGEAVPMWMKIGMVVSFVVLFLGAMISQESPISLLGAFGLLVFTAFAAYWKTYRQGEISVLYRGTYHQGPDGAGSMGELSLDLMFSVHAKKPLIGEAIGMAVIEPAYDYVVDGLRHDIRVPRPLRTLPELVSRNKNHYESRFPVERVSHNTEAPS